MKLDEQISLLADRVAKIEGGKPISAELFEIASRISKDVTDLRYEAFARFHKSLMSLMDLNKGIIEENDDRHEQDLVNERARIARLFASSDKWSGSYQDAVRLLAAAQPEEAQPK